MSHTDRESCGATRSPEQVQTRVDLDESGDIIVEVYPVEFTVPREQDIDRLTVADARHLYTQLGTVLSEAGAVEFDGRDRSTPRSGLARNAAGVVGQGIGKAGQAVASLRVERSQEETGK